MKNVQVIDSAVNTGYEIYSLTEDEFNFIFPLNGQNIEFIENVALRSSEAEVFRIMTPIWDRKQYKPDVKGIHGTLFYGLIEKEKYYDNKREPVINWKLVD